MNKPFSTIGFMLISTIFCISILAFVHESSKERIAKNSEIERYKSILYAFNILPNHFDEKSLSPTSTINDIPWGEERIVEIFKAQVEKIQLPISSDQQKLLSKSFLSYRDSIDIFIQVNKNKKIIAYGFPMKGKGLWGTITAFAVVSANLKKMVGIDFIEQVETPGLGARIIETEFKYLFRNLDLAGFFNETNKIPPIKLVKKMNKTNVQQSSNNLQTITGATQTVNGILAMLNNDLRFYLSVIKKVSE